jgi:hypothetical protein
MSIKFARWDKSRQLIVKEFCLLTTNNVNDVDDADTTAVIKTGLSRHGFEADTFRFANSVADYRIPAVMPLV